MAEVEKQETKPEDKEAEGAAPAEGAEGGESVEGQEVAPSSGKKKKLIALVIAIILCGGGGATFVMLKKKKETEEAEKHAAEQAAPKVETIFHDMDEMIINLNTEGKSVSFMKLKITLELEGKENLTAVQKMMPKINDVLQMYLRELRPSDMQGSVGLYRLKEELLLRINKIIYPSQVNDLLFKEVLVQ